MTFRLQENKHEENPSKAIEDSPRIAGKGGYIIVYHKDGNSNMILLSELKSDLELVERVAEVLPANKKE